MARTDRELLELAATAAGFDIEDDEFRGEVVFADDGKRWAPLHDDGDALRLAVKLGIGTLPKAAGVRNETAVCAHQFGWHVFDQLPADPYAATRRAIVTAAAEICSTMQVARQPSQLTEQQNVQKDQL
ncbi:MAG TPA: hypothetical protein VEA39_06130 [Methylophilaceae bacterium]|nr:hypothetical protein [Methylophilaceae bacterium]